MCQIIEGGITESNNYYNAHPGDKFDITVNGWIHIRSGSFKLRCLHPDGRSDTYFLVKGQRLVADEQATIEILEEYPETTEPEPGPHPAKKEVLAV